MAKDEGYSIRVASRMSGITVDTLRMWERRYDFPSPQRNGVGNRIYTDADVARLTMISRAMKLGYRVGEAIRFSDQQFAQILAEQPIARNGRGESGAQATAEVERLLSLIRSHKIEQLRHELRRITAVIGARRFVVEIAAALAETVGIAWAMGELSIYQEHLMTAALSTHLRGLLQIQQGAVGPKILLTTLPREQHGLGLEMAALMASMSGASVETLGPDSPTSEIAQAAAALHAQVVGLSVSVAAARSAATAHVEWLAEHLPKPLGFWIGGKGAALLEGLPTRVRVIHDWQELDLAIEGLSRGL
jgi:MerR family transcriptional regulator, light-induced transcriptional regulator